MLFRLALADGRADWVAAAAARESLPPPDCLGSIAGIGDIDAVRPVSREVPLADGAVRVLGLDALIRSKAALGSPKDREALVQLRALRERRRDGGHQETK